MIGGAMLMNSLGGDRCRLATRPEPRGLRFKDRRERQRPLGRQRCIASEVSRKQAGLDNVGQPGSARSRRVRQLTLGHGQDQRRARTRRPRPAPTTAMTTPITRDAGDDYDFDGPDDRPTSARAGSRLSRQRPLRDRSGAPAYDARCVSDHHDARSDFHALIEIGDILVAHADAARRHRPGRWSRARSSRGCDRAMNRDRAHARRADCPDRRP